ncbi:MAG: hypothetical protein ACI84R_002197 [Candidatus Azotimanducaceae bacterium]
MTQNPQTPDLTITLDDPNTKLHLPRFVRDNVDGDGVWAYLKDFHTGNGAYAARRKHISEQFPSLLDYLSEVGAPADTSISATLSRYNADGVSEVWQKALARRKTDPERAITSARTLLEEVCKRVLEDAGLTPQDKWDLSKLYREAANLMTLSPSQHTAETFKRILGGCQSVVENLGGLRNKISDAHGGGPKKVRPSERHAALAVNLAGSMAMFLIDTWKIHQAKQAAKEAQQERRQEPITDKDVRLVSRKNYANEIHDMQRIVDELKPDMTRRIEEVWCVSKATATYSICIRDGLWIPDMQWAVNTAICDACGGHNGVYFEGDAPVGIDLDPNWPDMDNFIAGKS